MIKMSEKDGLNAHERARMKALVGWTDEQIDNLSPKMLKFLRRPRSFGIEQYKMIAEVVRSENCSFRLKKGDKFVFGSAGILLPDESTASLCLWAMAPLLPFNYMIYDRLCEELDPNGIFPDHVKCTDVGVACGGFGEVLFKVSCQKESWSLSDVLARKYLAKQKSKKKTRKV
jgi:uncharacterized repeat protein (TIGR04076 family)